jgi:hypothetical protein
MLCDFIEPVGDAPFSTQPLMCSRRSFKALVTASVLLSPVRAAKSDASFWISYV